MCTTAKKFSRSYHSGYFSGRGIIRLHLTHCGLVFSTYMYKQIVFIYSKKNESKTDSVLEQHPVLQKVQKKNYNFLLILTNFRILYIFQSQFEHIFNLSCPGVACFITVTNSLILATGYYFSLLFIASEGSYLWLQYVAQTHEL